MTCLAVDDSPDNKKGRFVISVKGDLSTKDEKTPPAQSHVTPKSGGNVADDNEGDEDDTFDMSTNNAAKQDNAENTRITRTGSLLFIILFF